MSLQVSNAWKTDIEKLFRNQGYLWLAVEISPPGLREGATVSASNTDPVSSLDTLTSGVVESQDSIGILEQNRWSLNGTAHILESKSEPYKSQPWCDRRLTHNSGAYTTLSFVFDKEYSMPGMYGVWDVFRDSWPTLLIIEGYDSLDALINTYTITNITQSAQFMDVSFEKVKRVVLKIQGWSNPVWRARCAEIVFGLHYDFNPQDILSATYLSSVSVASEELPQYAAEVSLENYMGTYDPLLQSGCSKYLQPKQRATYQWGFKLANGAIERAPAQTVFVTKIDIPTDSSSFKVSLGNRLDFLTDDYTSEVYTGESRSFGDLARSVLNNSNLLKQYDAEVPYVIAAKLDSLYTKAPLPKAATNVILQYIASATGTLLTIDPINGYINFRALDCEGRDNRSVVQSQQLSDPAITLQEELYSIRIGIYQYKQSSEVTNVYTGTFLLTNTTTMSLAYETTFNPQIVVTNGTIVSSQCYAQKATVTITPTDPSVSVVITVTGYVVSNSVTYFETYHNPLISTGATITIANPLITEVSQLAALSSFLYDYYHKRQLMSIPYTGFPELLGGDMLTVTSKYGSVVGDLLESDINFDGGWTGTLTTRAAAVE